MNAPSSKAAVQGREITRKSAGQLEKLTDFLAIEEPLEICFAEVGSPAVTPISITMRTPGQDDALAIGFAYTEGLIKSVADLVGWEADPEACAVGNENRFILRFQKGKLPEADKLQRNFYTTSSCGVCGKASIAALEAIKPEPLKVSALSVKAETLHALPASLRNEQQVFDQTGGLHAAALFDETGQLLLMREDVGRHNALDKLIGATLLHEAIDPSKCVLLLSGRASFELVQKALMAGIPVMAAVGAPSSLAVSLAEANGMALAGFVSSEKFNLYCSNKALNLQTTNENQD